jgi:hypothetical protein
VQAGEPNRRFEIHVAVQLVAATAAIEEPLVESHLGMHVRVSLRVRF